MKSEEQNKVNNMFNNTISHNYFIKEKTKNLKNNPKYYSILNNPIVNKFNFRKQKTDFRLKSNSTNKNIFSLNTLNSVSFYDSLPSESNSDIDYLKKKLIINKSNINKKKIELQDLKIQYNKLIEESKNHKNLIYEILNLESEQKNNSSKELTNCNNNNDIWKQNITEEQLISKIKACKIDKKQEKKLKDSYDLIILRMEINNKKKLLLNKNNEYNNLKDNLKYKTFNEITTKLEDLIIEEERIKKEITKLEEILQKNNDEILPNLEKELEKEEKNYEEINKKEIEFKKKFNDKLHELNELKKEIYNIENKSKTKKVPINTHSREYLGPKTIGIKLKTKIDKIKNELKEIDKYKNERENKATLIAERKSKIDEQKKKNEELETKINELSVKNQELYVKTIEYNEEKKKLENRGKEQNKEIKRMKELQDKLDQVKNKKQELINEYKGKEKYLKENDKEQKEKNKQILENIKNFKNNINNINEQVNELSSTINDIQKDIDKCQDEINNKKKEIENLKNEEENIKKEMENENNEDIQNQNEDKKNNLIIENNNYKKENEKLTNEIKLIEEQIQKYIGMNDKLLQDK